MEYRVNESVLALVEEFHLFVKGGSLGVSPTLSGLPGSLGSEAVTARGELLILWNAWYDLCTYTANSMKEAA